MADQTWPEEAREAATSAVCAAAPFVEPQVAAWVAEQMLAALAPHVVPRGDEWEWGVRYRDGKTSFAPHRGEDTPRFIVSECPGAVVVRRRAGTAPGPWEEAPDA